MYIVPPFSTVNSSTQRLTWTPSGSSGNAKGAPPAALKSALR